MRAITSVAWGRIEMADLPEPLPGTGQIRVRQEASGIGAGDVLMAAGRPWIARPAFAAMLRPPILGRDVVGVVDAVGPGVTGFAVGDRVLGEGPHAWAEAVVLDVGCAAHLDPGIPAEVAAALPVSGVTALQALRMAGVRQGSRLVVVGASGGVGHLALQLGVHVGADVTAVCSAAHHDRMRGLGATAALDYRDVHWTDRGPWDAVLDLAGERPMGACLASLSPDGVYVSSAGTNGGPVLGPLPRLLGVALRGRFDRRATVLAASPRTEDLAIVAEHVRTGVIVPWISRVVAPEDVHEALDAHPGGKQVVSFSGARSPHAG
ncbi:MAG: NAD(P)-dependent alcohol dehydrogenase [Alphaproteobacteria bacterium]|nr:NAD(P)-dependent alcohol dehydrogenase [Alphaproteobacteria bacterium]